MACAFSKKNSKTMLCSKPRENQKTKAFWISFGFRSEDVFFLGFLECLFFGLDFFCFLKEFLFEVRQITTKTCLFWFLDRFLEDV